MGAVVVLTAASLSSADEVLIAWDSLAQRSGDWTRSDLTLVSADIVPTSTNVDVSIQNTGQTSMRDFSEWDVIIQYYATSSNQGLSISWLPHTTSSTPTNGQWTVSGLYMDTAASTTEVYEPSILNPGEVMVLRTNVTPAIPTTTDNRITIGAPNGMTLVAPFSR